MGYHFGLIFKNVPWPSYCNYGFKSFNINGQSRCAQRVTVKRKGLFSGRKKYSLFGIREAHSYSYASELVRWVSLGASTEIGFGGWPEDTRAQPCGPSPPSRGRQWMSFPVSDVFFYQKIEIFSQKKKICRLVKKGKILGGKRKKFIEARKRKTKIINLVLECSYDNTDIGVCFLLNCHVSQWNIFFLNCHVSQWNIWYVTTHDLITQNKDFPLWVSQWNQNGRLFWFTKCKGTEMTWY